MKRTDAENLALKMLSDHGLSHIGFKWNRGKNMLGAAHSTKIGGTWVAHTISLSALFVDLLPEDEIRDVILHEIAHVKAGHDAGHGPEFRRAARAIGHNGTRCVEPSAAPEGTYEGKCAAGHVYPFHRLPQRVKYCPKCPGRFTPANRLILSKGGRVLPEASMPQRYRQELTFQRLKGKA